MSRVLRNQLLRTFDKGGASPRANAVSINQTIMDMDVSTSGK